MTDRRYIRQTSLAGFGKAAQEKLAQSSVLVVGLGGLGIPVAQYLNAMGVGTLGLVEQDTVELHNLQRQVIYTESDIGQLKLEVAGKFLKRQNSGTRLRFYPVYLNRNNALDIVQEYDVVVDATDNFPTRYLINDSCVMLGKPFVYGALHGYEGQVSVFNHQGGPTYRCIFPDMPSAGEIPSCDANGVLGVLPGIVGNLQALETVKLLCAIGERCSGSLLLYDGLYQTMQKITFPVNRARKEIKELQKHYGEPGCTTIPEIGMDKFVRLAEKYPRSQVIDVRQPEEFAEYHIAGSRNIPLNDLPAISASLDEALPVYVICASGKRSAAAVQTILNLYPGITAFSVSGGIQKYRALCI